MLLRPLHLALIGVAIAVPAAAQSTAEIGGLRYIGAVTVPNDKMVDGTLVGGLSGIDYDAAAEEFDEVASGDRRGGCARALGLLVSLAHLAASFFCFAASAARRTAATTRE